MTAKINKMALSIAMHCLVSSWNNRNARGIIFPNALEKKEFVYYLSSPLDLFGQIGE